MSGSAGDRRKTRLAEVARFFTRARILAIVLIAVAVIGLAYLRFAPADAMLSQVIRR